MQKINRRLYIEIFTETFIGIKIWEILKKKWKKLLRDLYLLL